MLRPEIQDIQRILKQEAGNGHIIFICLQQLYLTWRKSDRSYDRFTAEVQRMTWMTSTWTPLYGVYPWTSRFKPQVILVETKRRICDQPRINSWSLWNSFSKWLKSWATIREKSMVWLWLITKNLRGDRRLYYVTKLLRVRMPKPKSSPTRCSEWEASVTNQSKPGRTKLNGIWKMAISKIWIESMESRWSSSWKISQDSLHWAFSKTFKKMSNSKKGSPSCQCTTTLYGDNEETQQSVRQTLLQLTLVLADSCSGVGHFGTWITEEMVRNLFW